MLQGGSTTTALAAGLSWLALVFIGLVHAAGGTAPRMAEVGLAVTAGPIALAGGLLAVAAIWRGPVIVEFSREDAHAISAPEAAYVRAASQLRGMIGGAGHLYPNRLLLPAASWGAAAFIAAGVLWPGLGGSAGVWPVALALVTALLTIVFPARAYFYRDTTGGGALLSPPSAAYRLKVRADRAAARARGEEVGAEMPTPAPPSRLGRPGSIEIEPRA